jgi:type VI secretion system protein ImpJ
VVPANYVSLPMSMVEPSVYATAVDQDRYFEAPQLFLALKAEMKQGDLLERAPQLIKISSADHINRLIKQALPGVELTHTAKPPSAIPVKLDYQYFRLGTSGPEWETIKLARNVAAYVPADFPQPQMELVVVLPPKK